MKLRTISIDESLDAQVDKLAHDRKVSKSKLYRELINAGLPIVSAQKVEVVENGVSEQQGSNDGFP